MVGSFVPVERAWGHHLSQSGAGERFGNDEAQEVHGHVARRAACTQGRGPMCMIAERIAGWAKRQRKGLEEGEEISNNLRTSSVVTTILLVRHRPGRGDISRHAGPAAGDVPQPRVGYI
eukprot:551127-Prymnesium_polylepis.1